MIEGDNNVDPQGQCEHRGADADRLHPDETSGSVEESGGAVEESGGYACPFCGSTGGCNHQIASWSGCNADWDGTLVDATGSLHHALEWTLWKGYALRGTQRPAPESFSYSLARLVTETSSVGHDEDADGCDWWGPIREYWMSVSEECGCVVLDHNFDDGACGTCDHFKDVVAEHPEASIAKILQWAEKDVLDLRAWFELTTDDVPPTDNSLA